MSSSSVGQANLPEPEDPPKPGCWWPPNSPPPKPGWWPPNPPPPKPPWCLSRCLCGKLIATDTIVTRTNPSKFFILISFFLVRPQTQWYTQLISTVSPSKVTSYSAKPVSFIERREKALLECVTTTAEIRMFKCIQINKENQLLQVDKMTLKAMRTTEERNRFWTQQKSRRQAQLTVFAPKIQNLERSFLCCRRFTRRNDHWEQMLVH